jgi:hypothetical protein
VLFYCIVHSEGHRQVEENTLISEDRQIIMFKIETLVAATKNFHADNKLSEGGFGPIQGNMD